jgi:paraquat-inducible protein B
VSTGQQNGDSPRRTVSDSRKSWWPGWIWGVPVAAIAVVVWLLVQSLSSRGVDASVVFSEAAGMKSGDTKILYRGLTVGHVTSVALEPDGIHVLAKLDLDRNMAGFLRAGTRFYLQGAEPSFSDLSSLKALIAGPSIVLAPGSGAPARHFIGMLGEPPAALQIQLPYLTVFTGDGGALKVGAAVKLRGFVVGEVQDVRLSIDATTGTIVSRVVLVLDPTRFHIAGANPAANGWRKILDTTLDGLIRHGLRARLTQTPPMLGAHEITLDIEAHANPASLGVQGVYPEIPAAPPAGLDVLLSKAGEIPLDEIGASVRAATARLETLLSSKQLNDSILHLNSALGELDRTAHAVGPKLGPTVDSARAAAESLRKAASQIDATAAVAKRTIGARGVQPSQNLQDALRELTEAAQAVRSLADELEQHPESLIRGRR